MGAIGAVNSAVTWDVLDQSKPILIAAMVLVVAAVYWLQLNRTPGPSVLLGQTLPLLGDTLAVKKDPCAYFINSYLRYGGVYRTSMLGLPVYVVLEPSVVRELLRSGGGCTFSVPFKSFNTLLDDWDHMVDSPQHDFWRKTVATALSPSTIESSIPALAGIIQSSIRKWAQQGSIQLMDETGDMALEFAIKVLVGVPLRHTDRTWFKSQMLHYCRGLYVLPLPLPWSTFSRARVAKSCLLKALEQELQADVEGLVQQEPAGAGEGVGEGIARARRLTRLDGVGKHALLHDDSSLQLDPQRLAASMAGLKEREAAAAAAARTSISSRDDRAAAAAAAVEAPSGIEEADSRERPAGPNMAEAQLEVLKVQRRLSVQTAAMRVLGSLIGAVDTTRYQMFSVLAVLGQLPDRVEALRREQQQVLSSHGPALTPSALADMPLLEACIKEATRLLSASRVVMRQATRTLHLSAGGETSVTVPRGAYIILSVDCMHALEPTLWKGPASLVGGPGGSRGVPEWMDWRGRLQLAYRPERWLGEAGSRPRHLLTFGMGPHLCLGMNLVLTEIKLLLLLLLREGLSWHFTDPDLLKKMSVFPGLKPAPGTDTLVLTRTHQPMTGSPKQHCEQQAGATEAT